jgi:hypothetical protein
MTPDEAVELFHRRVERARIRDRIGRIITGLRDASAISAAMVTDEYTRRHGADDRVHR